MQSIKNLAKLYEISINDLKSLLTDSCVNEDKLIKLIDPLTFNEKFLIKNDTTYDINEISKIFRFYEKMLQQSFKENKEQFEIEFKLYILLIKVFTELCNTFKKDKEKRKVIDSFFQTLKESKNMLKLFLPLDIKHINILNNLIGEQLYYFSHINYHDFSSYPLEYSLEKYSLDLEKMFHGFDLSLSSNFGNKEFTNEDIEFTILKNNASFLLLTLTSKMRELESFENGIEQKFKNIIIFYKDGFKIENKEEENNIKTFENLLLNDFEESAKYIKKTTKHNLIEEKLELLRLDTDEYKQLIDIIIKIELQDKK